MSDLSGFFCVGCMDTCLRPYGLSKNVDYHKCVKKLIKNGFRNSGINRTFIFINEVKITKIFVTVQFLSK